MEKDILTVTCWFSCGWHTYKNNLKKILAGTVVFFVCTYSIRLLIYLPYGYWIRLGCYAVATPPLMIGYTFFCLRLTRGSDARARDFLAGFSRFGRVWLTHFLLLMIFAPFLIPRVPLIVKLALFLTPALLLALKYSQSVIIVLDKNQSPLQAFKISGKITLGHKDKLFVLYLLMFILSLLQLLFFSGMQNSTWTWVRPSVFIGLTSYILFILVALPWWTLARANAYDSLSKRYEQAETKEEACLSGRQQ